MVEEVRKMSWDRLICDKRFGLEDYHQNKGGVRTDFRRDYDRLVFSSPFRRLQNKTQVFPLPGSIFVHNRLTHSLEVSCVGKSMADTITVSLQQKYADEPWVQKLSSIGDIVAAACLAHDMGNPPFGHSGEKAISTFFSEGEGMALKSELTEAQWADLTHFEGNANAFRVLTHQFKGRRNGGFAMTYSTLASIVKYPFESRLAGDKNKFGFFNSEVEDFCRVADELGMIRKDVGSDRVCYARHPLVYIVEAADDICYLIMDLEDAHKLKIIDTATTVDTLLRFFEEEDRQKRIEVMDKVDDPNEKIAYLRSCVVDTLVRRSAEVFVENEEAILRGEFDSPLLSKINRTEREAYNNCKRISEHYIYNAGSVVDVELGGLHIISFLMQKLVNAVVHPHLNYSQLLLSKVPEQYQTDAPTLYQKLQAVLDHVSAMTDVYALDLYRKLNGMSLPAI